MSDVLTQNVRTPLHRLQLDMAARCNSDDFYAYIEAFAVRDLSVKARIDSALACVRRKNGRSGAAIQVLMANLGVKKANPAGPLTVGSITLRHQENPITNYGANGSQISAEESALKSLNLFHHWSPGYIAILRATPDALQPSLQFSPLITYDVTFEFDLSLARTVKVLTPQISVADGMVTITCATEGAEIYSTLDESLPTKAPPNGDLYGAAFPAPAAGTVIRAVGYKAEHSASNVAEVTIE